MIASSGFWAWLVKRSEKKDIKTEMLIGLGHDRILYLGSSYIKRGYITLDEYENLYEYLYKPYEKMGGKIIKIDQIEFGNKKYDLAIYEYNITEM